MSWSTEIADNASTFCTGAMFGFGSSVWTISRQGALMKRGTDGVWANVTFGGAIANANANLMAARSASDVFVIGPDLDSGSGKDWGMQMWNGASWSDVGFSVAEPQDGYPTGIGGVASSTGTLYAVFSNNQFGTFTAEIAKSTDGGTTWHRIAAAEALVPSATVADMIVSVLDSYPAIVHGVWCNSENDVYILTARGVLHFNGVAWTHHSFGPTFICTGIWSKGLEVYIQGTTTTSGTTDTADGPSIQHSSDGGATWTAETMPSSKGNNNTSGGCIYGLDVNNVYCATSAHDIAQGSGALYYSRGDGVWSHLSAVDFVSDDGHPAGMYGYSGDLYIGSYHIFV